MKKKFIALTCSLLFAGASVNAKDNGTDPSVTILKEIQSFVVNKDGSYTETVEYFTQINEERAVASHSQRQWHFNRSLENFELLEAYTEKADGRKIPVKPEQIKLQQEPAYSGAPMFQDMQVKVAIYPEVAVGDKIYSRYVKTRKTAMFPGQFSDYTPTRFMPTKQLTVTYDMPADMSLRSEASGFTPTAPISLNGRTIYRWDYVPSENPRLEASSVSYADYGKQLTVSTFPDYASLGKAYFKTASQTTASNARIRAKTEELTRGLTEPRDKAFAIYDWVRKNIRYVAVYIGNGGLIPHNADEIMDNLYGDCKDHTSLMEAMLNAAGIESTPVLINAGNSYKLPQVASLGQFNHAITYIPSLNLYLDSTAVNVNGGFLPASEWDKPTILTKTGEIGRTPVTQLAQISNVYKVNLDANGAAQFEFSRKDTGQIAEPTRYDQSRWKKSDQDTAVENILKSYGMKGSGTVELGDLKKNDNQYEFKLKGHAENWAYLPGTVGISANSSLYAGLANEVYGLTNEAERTQNFVCPEHDIKEEATYQFPSAANILYLPKDVDIKTNFFQYQAKYTRSNKQVIIHRSFKSHKEGSRVCTPQDYLAMQATIKRMVQDLRSQFIVEVQ
ncbi:DUF3857 and transglutaminase domain-containing protein [Undibacterium sp. TS12]|uniref:DUF3857 domain-containing transglutaminase family protein n=1 Tax=Undibacterium sp. TS12 TaxID=2908202 RepID=UPI001F4CA282|nr:DUF3857 and transglutaminase domain-containing protein [Undibacterium sp. TS12]MCH8618435.1 DUF3857 and transglutaminase domain-containing protein [Undibacterium sp. TS12]